MAKRMADAMGEAQFHSATGNQMELRELLLNWFHAKGAIASGVVEGLKSKFKVTTRKAYGYRRNKAIRLALYHNLGDLPEPKHAHRFC